MNSNSTFTYLGGSTGAYLYEHPSGKKYVIKRGANAKQMFNEYMSNKIYEKFGINVPKAQITQINGEDVFTMEYLEGSVPLGDALHKNPNLLDDLSKGYLIDVLTANWDVVGTNINLDNIRVHNGKLYRVDLGGTLDTRAMGRDKLYSDTVYEIDSIRNFNSDLFSKITNDTMRESFVELFKEYLSNNTIDEKKLREDLISHIGKSSDQQKNKRIEYIINIIIKKIKNIHDLLY